MAFNASDKAMAFEIPPEVGVNGWRLVLQSDQQVLPEPITGSFSVPGFSLVVLGRPN
jgi:hypothetical protein